METYSVTSQAKKKREDVTCKITESFSIINENVFLITKAYKHQNIKRSPAAYIRDLLSASPPPTFASSSSESGMVIYVKTTMDISTIAQPVVVVRYKEAKKKNNRSF